MSLLSRIRRLPTPEPTTADDEPPTDGHRPTAPGDTPTPPAGPPWRARLRRGAGVTLTLLAFLLVFVALVAPNQISQFRPDAFARIPVEGLVGVAVLLALPGRGRRLVAALFGLALGTVALVKLFDMGSWTVLNRQFDLVLDWGQLDDARTVLADSVGATGATGVVVAVGFLVLAVPVLLTLSVLRVARAAARRPTVATRATAVAAVAWLVCAALGAQTAPGMPVASNSAALLVQDRTERVRTGLQDREAFIAEASVDAFRDTPGDQLLTALRGKDVVFAFVESYGRSAVEDPQYATEVGALLDDGTRRLGAAGFSSSSGWLTSPTFGGYSWLAHSTLYSGLSVNNQQRYRTLVASDRLTLVEAFRRADWRTVGVEPANTFVWPEGDFYGFEQVYDSRNLGYAGPAFGWVTMPDQYTLAAFQRLEHGRRDRGPIMAELSLVSSHTPWAPLPRMVGWDEVGDGSIYGPMAREGDPPEVVWRDPARVRTEYRRSVEYTLGSLISYVETYGDDDLVLVLLGDHQPAPIVTGEGASWDVPISVIARDPAVLDRIADWQWHDGLKPGPDAPVWPMDAFRDRFLTAYSAQGAG